MKTKIIDLLVKIANKEESTKVKTKYDSVDWNEIDFLFSIYKEFEPRNNDEIVEFLNDYVEIIEEPKEIKYPILHKTAPSETTGDQMPNWRNLIDCNFEYLSKTICQLIDEINTLKDKKEE